MPLNRAFAVIFLTLGLALGSVIGVAAATEQAFAKPCPMHDQHGGCPCCKGDCTGAMMSCSVVCSVPFGSAALPEATPLLQLADGQLGSRDAVAYNPFVTGPPPPIPII
jgi:hypothetical protein